MDSFSGNFRAGRGGKCHKVVPLGAQKLNDTAEPAALMAAACGMSETV
jgi:hypothetical protein